jgi:hypothetical protein
MRLPYFTYALCFAFGFLRTTVFGFCGGAKIIPPMSQNRTDRCAAQREISRFVVCAFAWRFDLRGRFQMAPIAADGAYAYTNVNFRTREMEKSAGCRV